MEALALEVESIAESHWKPTVMIDIDSKEYGMCKNMDWKALYCDFHISKCLESKFHHHSKDKDYKALWRLWENISAGDSDSNLATLRAWQLVR